MIEKISWRTDRARGIYFLPLPDSGNAGARALRVFFFLFLILGLSLEIAGAETATALLPNSFGEWEGTFPQVTEFTVAPNAENLGQWQSRVYARTAPISSVEANLMEGPGPGTLFISEGTDGPFNAAPTPFQDLPSSAYEVVSVAGKRAVLERGDVTGQALAVALGENQTLTLETKSLSREEFLSFARKLLAALEENDFAAMLKNTNGNREEP
jgi:hypothetical protein